MDMTYVRITQDNYNATKHMEQRAERMAQRVKRTHRRFAVIITVMIIATLSVAFLPKVDVQADSEASEVQEFIVRYGRAWNWGRQVQMNDDRSIIDVLDAPELVEGTDVRVLFNTHGTADLSDDTVVDVTEVN